MRYFADIVLADLRSSHRPLSAYELARRISAAHGKIYAPNTIYRSLRELGAAGLVKHIASLKAFIALSRKGCSHPVFTICDHCGVVEEVIVAGLADELTALGRKRGFSAHSFRLELIGRCAKCRVADDVAWTRTHIGNFVSVSNWNESTVRRFKHVAHHK